MQSPRHWGWSCWTQCHCHSQENGSHSPRFRYALCSKRAGPVSRSRVHRGGHERRRLWRRRLRKGHVEGVHRSRDEAVHGTMQRSGHRDHHRADSRSSGSDIDHRRDGRSHEAWIRDCRLGCRSWWQLRDHRSRPALQPQGCDGHWIHRSAFSSSDASIDAVLEQHHQVLAVDVAKRRAFRHRSER